MVEEKEKSSCDIGLNGGATHWGRENPRGRWKMRLGEGLSLNSYETSSFYRNVEE